MQEDLRVFLLVFLLQEAFHLSDTRCSLRIRHPGRSAQLYHVAQICLALAQVKRQGAGKVPAHKAVHHELTHLALAQEHKLGQEHDHAIRTREAAYGHPQRFLGAGLVLLLFAKKGADDRVRVVRFASVFGNCGFFGLPFLQSLFDTGEMLIYAAVFVAIYNLLSWTVGIWLITGDKKFIKIKKAFLNPPFLALCVSLPLFIILKQPLSSIGEAGAFLNDFFVKLTDSFNLLAEMTTPVSLSIVGIRLAQMKPKQLFGNGWVYCSSALKLLVFPLVAFAILMLFPSVNVEVKYCVFFSCAMPTATQTLLFAEHYGGDPYTASPAVLLNTCLSILTIPLMSLLLGFLG